MDSKQISKDLLDYLKSMQNKSNFLKNIGDFENINSELINNCLESEKIENNFFDRDYYSIFNPDTIALCETKDEVYTDYESVKNVVDLICKKYNSIIENTSSITEMADRAYNLSGERLSDDSKEIIEKYNQFCCYIQLGQVVTNYDLKNINEILSKKNLSNPSIRNKLKNYIKYSKTGNLVYINSFIIKFCNYKVNLNNNDLRGIFDFNLLYKAFKESGLDINFFNPYIYRTYYEISYDDFLDATINQETINLFIYDKKFTKTFEGYAEYTPVNTEKQKVLKRR